MPKYCVVTHCKSESNLKEGISLHTIPFFNDDRPEAKKRRKRWVDFVCLHRKHWQPSEWSAICSKHFKSQDYETMFSNIEGLKNPVHPRLRRDDFGIIAYPTVFVSDEEKAPPQSARTRRKIMKEIRQSQKVAETVGDPCMQTEEHDIQSVSPVAEINDERRDDTNHPSIMSTHQQQTPGKHWSLDQSSTIPTPHQSSSKERQMRNRIITLRSHLKIKKEQLRKEKLKNQKLLEQLETLYCKDSIGQKSAPPHENNVEDHLDDPCKEDCLSSDEDEEMLSDENEVDMEYETETETESSITDEEDNQPSSFIVGEDNLRTHPKFIVFWSQLLMLFQICHSCGAKKPLVEAKEIGTMVVVTTDCSSPKCPKRHTVWSSQPNMPSMKIPAGNFLLCMAILLSGGSVTKVFTMFKHMGLRCMSLASFFHHQRTKLFPTILLYWRAYQSKMIEKVKSLGSALVMAGDGRHDSMGHSAKFGAYTMFCCTLPMILHFELIQRNQAGNSPAMEFMGFQQAMTFLMGLELEISTFISDRHTTITSCMKKNYSNITHYFDLWHLKKKIRKTLTKIAKLSGCEVLSEWIKPAENHLHWSATSTHNGNGLVIWAKFISYLDHIINKHTNLGNALFNKCHHGPNIPHRKWLQKDSILYEKVVQALTKQSLIDGIMQASPLSQTSCLEGFHSVVNHFSPKMIAYSYSGQYCRHILAAVHFNMNLHRDVSTTADGSSRIKVVYPKFKNGEATVREQRITQNFDYVEEIFQTFLTNSQYLKDAMQDLVNMTPPPMNTMLVKQPRAEAIQKSNARKAMTVKDVPPTTPVPQIPPQPAPQDNARSKPCCRICKRPMKGHHLLLDCPRNQK